MNEYQPDMKIVNGALKHFGFTKSHPDYNDLQQELCLVAWQSELHFNAVGYPSLKLDSYVFCQCRRFLMHYLRKQKRRQLIVDKMLPFTEKTETISDLSMEIELLFGHLSVRERKFILICLTEGYEPKVIATKLNVSTRTVRNMRRKWYNEITTIN